VKRRFYRNSDGFKPASDKAMTKRQNRTAAMLCIAGASDSAIVRLTPQNLFNRYGIPIEEGERLLADDAQRRGIVRA
jgi:hypothetical protein